MGKLIVSPGKILQTRSGVNYKYLPARGVKREALITPANKAIGSAFYLRNIHTGDLAIGRGIKRPELVRFTWATNGLLR